MSKYLFKGLDGNWIAEKFVTTNFIYAILYCLVFCPQFFFKLIKNKNYNCNIIFQTKFNDTFGERFTVSEVQND